MANLSLIKKLRENSGCGIADCNKALSACNDNYDEAIDWLRKKGLSTAAKKSNRITTEGLVGICINNNKAAIIELNSETDFVANNEKFQNLVKSITKAAVDLKANENYIENLKKQKIDNKTIEELLIDNIAVIGENLQLRRGKTIILNEDGVIASYIHTSVAENLGKIGVIIALKSKANKESLLELGKKLCMHIAAAKPEFLNQSLVPTEKLEREKSILIEQAKTSNKPQNIIDKMIEGRIKKFYEEICLLDQLFIMDDKTKISDLLIQFKKETNNEVIIQDYCFYVLGEGLEKQENNFAEEVASMSK